MCAAVGFDQLALRSDAVIERGDGSKEHVVLEQRNGVGGAVVAGILFEGASLSPSLSPAELNSAAQLSPDLLPSEELEQKLSLEPGLEGGEGGKNLLSQSLEGERRKERKGEQRGERKEERGQRGQSGSEKRRGERSERPDERN